MTLRRDADDDRLDAERVQRRARLLEQLDEPPRHVPEPDEQQSDRHNRSAPVRIGARVYRRSPLMSRLATIAGMVAVLGVSAAAYAAPPLQTQDSAPNGVIVTQGEATLTVPPDRAFVQMSAEGRAQKAADAQRIAADAMTSLQSALKSAGVAADAIRTIGYTLTPENDYVNGRQQFRGFLARNQIEVRVDDLEQAERDHRCDRDVRCGVGVRVAVRCEESKHGRAGGSQAGGRRRDVARDRDRGWRQSHRRRHRSDSGTAHVAARARCAMRWTAQRRPRWRRARRPSSPARSRFARRSR